MFALVASAIQAVPTAAQTVARMPTAAFGTPERPIDPGVIRQLEKTLDESLGRAGIEIARPSTSTAPEPPGAQDIILPADLADLSAKATQARENLDYGTGVRALVSLTRQLEQRLAKLGTIDPLAQAQIDLANLYLARRQTDLAATELVKAARLKPGLELDPRKFSPRLIAAYNQARKTVEEEPKAELSVEVKPDGALVWLDGVAIGEAPLRRPVTRGPHVVFVSAPGHLPRQEVIEATPNGFVRLSTPLEETRAATLARQLERATLQVGESRARALAVALRQEMVVDAVLVTGVIEAPKGYALIARWVGSGQKREDDQTAVLGLDVGLNQAGDGVDVLLQRLAAEEAATPELIVLRTPYGASAAELQDALTLDFRAHVLGQVPPPEPPPPAVAVAPSPATTATTTGPTSAPTAPPEGVDEGFGVWPWLAGGAGGALILAAIVGAAVSAGLAVVYLQVRPLDNPEVPDATTRVEPRLYGEGAP